MPGCRRYRAMMAAALYESLDTKEDAALQSHLEACPVCRKENAALRQVLTLLPEDDAVIPWDLTTALRARLAEEELRPAPFAWLPVWGAPAFAGACALALAFSLLFLGPEGGLLNGSAPAAPPLAMPATPAPGMEALEEAQRHIAANQHDAAASVLRAAVQTAPGHTAAGEAQRALAALTFEHFRLYEIAFHEYMKLRNQFGAVYREDPESIDRFELLAEEWENQFQALATIDAARDRVYADPFRQLEHVMAAHPGKHVAGIALREMQALVRNEDVTHGDEMHVLEAVRQRCVDPVAVAQVNLYLGDLYCDAQVNKARARALYQEVIDSTSPMLAERAGHAMARLDLTP